MTFLIFYNTIILENCMRMLSDDWQQIRARNADFDYTKLDDKEVVRLGSAKRLRYSFKSVFGDVEEMGEEVFCAKINKTTKEFEV